MFVDYTYYETLGTQQPSLQCQISCCLVNHPSDVAPYDWKDTSVSNTPKIICFWKKAEDNFIFSNFDIDLAAADVASGDARRLPGSLNAKRGTAFLLRFTAAEEQQRY